MHATSRVIADGDAGSVGLLPDMGELVGEEPAADGRAGAIGAVAEHEVVADRVGVGVDGTCRGVGEGTCVDADVAEIVGVVAREGLQIGVGEWPGGASRAWRVESLVVLVELRTTVGMASARASAWTAWSARARA